MTLALLTIRDLYASMEQGNIGKLVIALDDAVWVYTAPCMGGNRRGREGILQQVPAFYRPGTGIKKTTDHFVEQGSMIIVLGNIQIAVPGAGIDKMSFVDVWNFENGIIKSVNFFYNDPGELYNYLEHFS